MELVVSILIMMGRELLSTFTSPLYVFIYVLLFLLVAWQYRRQQNISASLHKNPQKTYFKAAVLSTLLGILGGILASILLVLLGIDLTAIGITQLWVTALALMLIQPRFLCFAYAAGVLAIANLLFGYPHISIPQLMGLVAVLHLVEGLLILLNGPFNALPVYIKKHGQLRGGFNLQLFWPIPLVALMSVGYADLAGTGMVMPQWWPLLKDYATFADDQTFALLPVLAILGYGEISTSRTPFQASRKSSLWLLLFSLMLMLLAVLASHWAIFLPLLAIFSPLGHELVIWLGMRAETRPPIYVQPNRGFMILDILAGSSAARAGLKSRDIVIKTNGVLIEHYDDFEEQLRIDGPKNTLELIREGSVKNITMLLPGDGTSGIIPVPDSGISQYLAGEDDRIFVLARRIWQRIKMLRS